MSELENRKELNEAEVEAVSGGKKLIVDKDDAVKENLAPRAPEQGSAKEARIKRKDVFRPLPFPQDRR